MNKSFLKKVKENMLSEKEKLLSKLNNNSPIDTEIVDLDGDETDEIQGNLLLEITSQLNSRNNNKLMLIEDALKRLDDNEYGVCEDCGEDIPEKRLVANPYFLTCISCAEERELENKQVKRV